MRHGGADLQWRDGGNAALTVLTDSTGEPLTTTEVRKHVRGSTEDNTLIDMQTSAARQYCENFTHRSFLVQEFRYSLERWPWNDGSFTGRNEIQLPRPVNASSTSKPLVVSFREEGNSTFTTLASTLYIVDIESEPGNIALKFGASWPTGALESGQSVRVDFWSGSTAVAGVDESLKQSILLLAGHWYENRESVVTGTVSTRVQETLNALLSVHKIQSVP